jgi:3-oxoacyl-[acyl-carrier-protein] synthase-1/3-oxoacyl-[acyl-carrier-protein] synthase II
MASAAVIAYGAASALGLGADSCDVGEPGALARTQLSQRAGGKPFGRVLGSPTPREHRPRALLELGLGLLVAELEQREPGWRQLRLGIVIGTSSGGMAALERALPSADTVAANGLLRESAYFSPLSGVSRMLGRAPDRVVSLYAACASSTLALGLGLRWLELERFDLVIAGGYDAESDWVSAGFDSLKATSAGPPRPFRAERDGMALGEGVALLALSRRRDAAHGYVRGFGATSDALHITAPDRTGQGLARAAREALGDAGLSPPEVDFVSVHGTGTSFNDAAEAAALELVFAQAAVRLPLHAAKPAVGHTLGAAGALESLFALSALERAVLPASASTGTPMRGAPAHLLERNIPASIEHCLKLSTAFGGANAALVLSSSPGVGESRRPRAVYLAAAGVPVVALEQERLEGLLVAPAERLPRSDALSSLAVAAAGEALRDARKRGLALEPERTGVIVGSAAATLEADAAFAARVMARGAEHAEPRRFPATSPNACAGHVAIAFGLRGPSHAVGAGPNAAREAMEVARDWLEAGDADALLVIGAEATGETVRRVFRALALEPPPQGALALLLVAAPPAGAPKWLGVALTPELLDRAFALPPGKDAEMAGQAGLERLCQQAGLPGSGAFGTVRAPE